MDDYGIPETTPVDDLISLAHAIDKVKDTHAKKLLREAMEVTLSDLKPKAELRVLHFGTPQTDANDKGF